MNMVETMSNILHVSEYDWIIWI